MYDIDMLLQLTSCLNPKVFIKSSVDYTLLLNRTHNTKYAECSKMRKSELTATARFDARISVERIPKVTQFFDEIIGASCIFVVCAYVCVCVCVVLR